MRLLPPLQSTLLCLRQMRAIPSQADRPSAHSTPPHIRSLLYQAAHVRAGVAVRVCHQLVHCFGCKFILNFSKPPLHHAFPCLGAGQRDVQLLRHAAAGSLVKLLGPVGGPDEQHSTGCT